MTRIDSSNPSDAGSSINNPSSNTFRVNNQRGRAGGDSSGGMSSSLGQLSSNNVADTANANLASGDVVTGGDDTANTPSSCCPSSFLSRCRNCQPFKRSSGICSLCCCSNPQEDPTSLWLYRFHMFTKSAIWRLLYIFFSLFLLFGASIQELAVQDTGDIVFEVIRNIMLGFFILDMMLRCATDRNYFVCSFGTGPSIVAGGGGTNAGLRSYNVYNDTRDSSSCAVGSFLFWCDLISTLAILYDLSYINPTIYGVKELDIELDSNSLPIRGLDYNRLHPVDLEFNLLVVIARSARCARFVQHRAVVGASNKINWFWVLNYLKWLNPFHYYRRCKRRQRQTRLSIGVAGEEASFASTDKASVEEDKKANSWGVLQVGILAAVRAQAEAEAREARETSNQSRRGLWSKLRSAMRSVGLMGTETTAAEKHVAAIKIQRAWRNHVRFESGVSVDGDIGDIAHMMTEEDQFPASNRAHYVNSLDRSVRKRASLASFAQMNARSGGKLSKSDILASRRESAAPGSRFQSQAGKGRESQVGSDMRELTGQRVAIGTLLALVCAVLFTYTENSTVWPTTMVILHEQTMYTDFQTQAVNAAVGTSVPELFKYQTVNGSYIDFAAETSGNEDTLRERDIVKINVNGSTGTSVGWFDYSSGTRQVALVDIVATFFIILFWFFGVTAFSGPVMLLVITPIERMVRLLGMLMLDPLGYQSTSRFKKFILEEDDIIKNTRWTKEVLKGMETSFLMSTILRIGSLMKVGFGSAGVEIIRNNLQKGQSKNSFILNSQGSTVSCIFLFCDIRQFTDATECLQEEVFVFTNRIAAVVHSICHSYGGAANKNVGDAFLLSWSLEDQPGNSSASSESGGGLKAKSNQADKALLSVIKICISLHYDKFYLEPLTDMARGALKSKLKNRVGPVVQMGFGLHAGKAVQGAIGSPRKIDATYVSVAVDCAEFLEASTKKYGLQMLMSGSFHTLLHPNTRRRCRMIDKVFIVDEDEDADEDDDELHGERMDLFTFDMDVEAIHRPHGKTIRKVGENDTLSDTGSIGGETPRTLRSRKSSDRRSYQGAARQIRSRRRSVSYRSSNNSSTNIGGSEDFILTGNNFNPGNVNGTGSSAASIGQASVSSLPSTDENTNFQSPPELVLPTGPALYSHNVWQSPDMKRIRDKYVQGLFFQKFNAGLQAYYNKDWDSAQLCFQQVLDNFDDGPSKYFMTQMKIHKGVPPKDFREYGIV